MAELVDERERGLFVRQGHVQAAAAGGAETAHGGLECGRRGVDQLVREVLPGLPREERVNERRPTVFDRMADESVTVGRRAIVGHSRPIRCCRFCVVLVPLPTEIACTEPETDEQQNEARPMRLE